jgi:purine-binding chemotaxis protein CheW
MTHDQVVHPPRRPRRRQAASRPAGQQAAAESPQQYLTFLLGGEMFAVGILNVKEIIEYGNVTEIPMMPAFIRGVINLRGAWCR